MRLVARDKSICLEGAPEAIRPLVRQWFGVARRGDEDARCIEIEPRRVLALSQHYRDRVSVSPSVQAWLTRGLEAAEQRISRRESRWVSGAGDLADGSR